MKIIKIEVYRTTKKTYVVEFDEKIANNNVLFDYVHSIGNPNLKKVPKELEVYKEHFKEMGIDEDGVIRLNIAKLAVYNLAKYNAFTFISNPELRTQKSCLTIAEVGSREDVYLENTNFDNDSKLKCLIVPYKC